jgi:beta-lactamase regulating signal transducer with metallopeptidase domain
MIDWMIYCLVAAALVAAAARAAEWITRFAGMPVRWCWAIAMAMLVALAAVAPLRQTKLTELPAIQGAAAANAAAIPLQAGIEAVSRGLPSSTVIVAGVAWSLASAVLVFIILSVHARLRRVRHTWPLAEMHGARVRVAPEVGPVVIGFRAPEIVVPRWLLARTSDEQKLIVTHEAEHVRAKDTVLLGAGIFVAALMPWNPFVWYMFSRLRLAVELDCDSRVLRSGTTVESYGVLLIEVASHATPMRFGVAALTNNTSHLHQRIIAMKHIVPKYARLRAGVVGALGAAALLAACEAKMPTSAEVEAMDVGGAERRLALVLPKDNSISAYLVDRKEVPREVALALKAEDITAVEVVRPMGEPAKLVISTRNAPLAEPRPDVSLQRRTGTELMEKKMFQTSPLLLIDGVRVTQEAFRAIDRSTIESIEVLKGRSVLTAFPNYSADDLAGGVITVKTKQAGVIK